MGQNGTLDVSAVIVTKGDVDLTSILVTMPFDDVIVWDNSREQDYKVCGRYAAMKRAKHDVVFVQDDDATTEPEAICQQYHPGVITANVPKERRPFYSDGVTLLGWGAVFDRDLTSCFEKYLKRWPMDDLFLRECDRIFTGLNRSCNIDVPFRHLPQAFRENRMGQEKRHLEDLAEIRKRVYSLRA